VREAAGGRHRAPATRALLVAVAPLALGGAVSAAGCGQQDHPHRPSRPTTARRTPPGPASGARNPSTPAVDWTTFGFDSTRTGENPFESRISPGNVGSLRNIWSFDVGGAVDAEPLVVHAIRVGGTRRDLVLVATEQGDVFALDAATGREQWRRHLGAEHTACPDLPGGVFGVTSTPAVDRSRGVAYAAGGDDRIYALDLATGAIEPHWPVSLGADVTREHVWAGVTLSGRLLYVETASYCDRSTYRGRLVAIDTSRARILASGLPATAAGDGGGVWGWGGVAVDPRTGDVYGATANAFAPLPEDFGYSEHVVRLTPDLHLLQANHPAVPTHGDADFGAGPVLIDRPGCPPLLAVTHKSGALLLYDRDRLAAGPVQLIQIASPKALSLFGTYAYSPRDQTLFVANPSDSRGPYHHGVLAFGLGSDCRLALRWQHAVGARNYAPPSPPVVANGVVFAATGDAPGLFAFDARTGRMLWSSGFFPHAPPYGAPTVSGGRVYLATWDRHVYAFGLGPGG